MGDLSSHPPVVKVFDFVLQRHEVTAGPEEEGMEPSREQFDGFFLAMPNHVSLRIQINNVRGLIRALALVVTSDSAIFQPLDPFGRTVDPITKRNVEVGHSPIILNVAIGGLLECVFIVLDMIMEPSDLFFKVAYFAGGLGSALSDGREEPISDGLEDGCVEVGVGCQGGCNCTRQHRWFQTPTQPDRERDVVLGEQDV